MKKRSENQHAEIASWLPFYTAGDLDSACRAEVEAHLAGCAQCQADLRLWHSVHQEVREQNEGLAVPTGLVAGALAQIQASEETSASHATIWQHAYLLMRAQVPLVRREIWPASLVIMAIGYLLAVLLDKPGALQALAPLAAAASLSIIYGSENDPALEIALATPTSPRQILLARLGLVFSWNLILALIATLGLAPFFATTGLGSLILGWLAPMAFLSTLALALSLVIGSSNAITVAYLAWLAQLFAGFSQAGSSVQAIDQALQAYRLFWANPSILLGLSALLSAAVIWYVGRQESSLPRLA